MEITIRERTMLDRFRCVDTYRKIKVPGPGSRQGDLYCFKKSGFEYLVLSYDPKEDVYYR